MVVTMRRTTGEISTDGERPIDCPRCLQRMTLARTEPRPLGYELRIHECVGCDVEHQVFVDTDPTRSPPRDWVGSSL